MRRRLPRYGTPRRGLDPWRVHVCRIARLEDAYLARVWWTTVGAIRDARTGRTWRSVATPPDTTPRLHLGNWGDLTVTSAAEPGK